MKTLQASKWLTCQMLLESGEMRSLLSTLGEFHIALVGAINPKGSSILTHETFLETYRSYVENLKQGHDTLTERQRKHFSSIFTLSLDDLYTMPIQSDRELLKVIKPVIQLQYHQIGYSTEEMKFRPMVLGSECLSWGLQFAYPQLVQDADSEEIRKGNDYPNSALYHTLQRWMRKETIPTPFIVQEKKINVPMRLGKQCLPWINTHPGLQKKGIHVA